MFWPKSRGLREERLQGGGVMVCSAGTASLLVAIWIYKIRVTEVVDELMHWQYLTNNLRNRLLNVFYLCKLPPQWSMNCLGHGAWSVHHTKVYKWCTTLVIQCVASCCYISVLLKLHFYLWICQICQQKNCSAFFQNHCCFLFQVKLACTDVAYS